MIRDFEMPVPSDGKSSLDLDLSGLSKGIYLIRFSNSSFTHVKKLFIE
jgi:hypothetical protein